MTEEYIADLTVIHVVPSSPAIPVRYMDTDLRSHLIADARERLQAECDRLNINARICVDAGEIAKGVSAAAQQHEADLLVIGRGEQSGLGRLRTHSYSIIRESQCPVLSV